MRKIYLFIGFLLLVLSSLFLINSLYRKSGENVQTEVSSVQDKVIELQLFNGLSKDNTIVSLFVLDKNKLIVTLDPKPNIVLFSRTQETNFSISEVFERDKWKLNDLDFIDSSTGFAVGQYGTVLKTTDGGDSWIPLPKFSEFDLRKVKFLNRSVGYIAGRFGIRNEKTDKDEWSTAIYKTTDGGDSWIKSYHGDNERDIFQIAVFSPDIALASINGNRLIRTEDGGQKWNDIIYGGKEVISVFHAPDKTLWLVGGKGEFLKSEDAGVTWKEPDNFPNDFHNYEWWSITIDNSGNGLAVSEEGIIVYTNDTGKTWKRFPQKIDEPLRSVQIKDGMAIISGENNFYKFDF